MAEPVDDDQVATRSEPTDAGGRMRAAREAAGLTLQQIAERTRVPQRHLAALEEGDYGSLPGTTYCAGFARAYARAVGLDEASLVNQVRNEIEAMGGVGQSSYDFDEPLNPARIPPRWLAFTAAIIAVLLAAGYGIWRMQLNTPPTDDQIAAQTAQGSAAAPPKQATPPPAASNAAAAPTGPVVMTAADDVWLRVYEADGKRIFEGTLMRGQSYTVPADAKNPLILTGRPDALAVTVGGQAIPALGTAERTISDVPVSAAALLARARQPAAPEDGTAATASNAATAGPSGAAPGNAATR